MSLTAGATDTAASLGHSRPESLGPASRETIATSSDSRGSIRVRVGEDRSLTSSDNPAAMVRRLSPQVPRELSEVAALGETMQHAPQLDAHRDPEAQRCRTWHGRRSSSSSNPSGASTVISLTYNSESALPARAAKPRSTSAAGTSPFHCSQRRLHHQCGDSTAMPPATANQRRLCPPRSCVPIRASHFGSVPDNPRSVVCVCVWARWSLQALPPRCAHSRRQRHAALHAQSPLAGEALGGQYVDHEE